MKPHPVPTPVANMDAEKDIPPVWKSFSVSDIRTRKSFLVCSLVMMKSLDFILLV